MSEQTHSLHETCQKLLTEQTELDKVVDDIKKPIEYLLELDRIGSRFGVKLETPLSNELYVFLPCTNSILHLCVCVGKGENRNR